jgi:hypothetical protein
VIPYSHDNQARRAIVFANNELAAAPEQTPTQFAIGQDVENVSLD